MKELQIYLSFFRKNILVILAFGLMGLAAGFYYSSRISTNYNSSALFELSYTDETVEKKKLETDELVGVLRDGNLHQIIELSNVQTVEVYKPGPISLYVRVVSRSDEDARENLNRIRSFLFSRATITELSNIDSRDHKNAYVPSFLGLLMGLLCGCLLSLINTYLRKH